MDTLLKVISSDLIPVQQLLDDKAVDHSTKYLLLRVLFPTDKPRLESCIKFIKENSAIGYQKKNDESNIKTCEEIETIINYTITDEEMISRAGKGYNFDQYWGPYDVGYNYQLKGTAKSVEELWVSEWIVDCY